MRTIGLLWQVNCPVGPVRSFESQVVDRRTIGQVSADEHFKDHEGVHDVPATLDKLVAMGAKEHDSPRDRGTGFITASVIDPWGNVLGLMYNPHYLEILASLKA